MRLFRFGEHNGAFGASDDAFDLTNQAAGDDDTSVAFQVSAASTDTVSLAGSGIVFNNTFGSGVTPAFEAAIIEAENFFQTHFTDSVTLNCSFDLGALGQSFSGKNSYHPIIVSYAAFKAALASHATTADDKAAVASLPATDPSNGQGFGISVGEARILGLGGAAGSGVDDTIVLNSSLNWSYGQDAIGVLEHEISEGCMGRWGGLGILSTSADWGPMDLFRYSAPGQRDYTGGADGLPTYFSADGQHLSLQFHNSVSSTGAFDGFDLADWGNTFGDAFGSGGPGEPGTVSATDLQVMDVLGWTPASSGSPTDLSASTTPVTFNLTTSSAASSFGITSLPGSGATLVGSTYDDGLIIGTNDGSYTFDGRGGDNTAFIDGVGRAGAAISGTSTAGVHITLIGTAVELLNTNQIQFLDGTIEYDPNSHAAQVMRLYQAAFGRPPDAPGLAAWAQALDNGMTLTSVADSLISSPEFQARFPSAGQNTDAFVTQLYANVLHRAPDAAGLASWDQAISSGSMTPAQALVAFSESSESKTNTSATMQRGLYVPNEQAAQVARLYYSALGRPPDLAGFQGWASDLESGQLTLQQEADAFIQSPEFVATYGSLSDLGFVDLLYSNVLGRPADAAGAAAWSNALATGSMSRSGVVLGFSESPEHVADLAAVIENNGIKFA